MALPLSFDTCVLRYQHFNSLESKKTPVSAPQTESSAAGKTTEILEGGGGNEEFIATKSSLLKEDGEGKKVIFWA